MMPAVYPEVTLVVANGHLFARDMRSCRYQPREDLAEEERARVMQYAYMMQDAWCIHFPEGYNDNLHLMGHLWEPLKVCAVLYLLRQKVRVTKLERYRVTKLERC
jgi:hypothetical protein